MRKTILLGGILLAMSNIVAAEGDAAKGEALYAVCSGCHGVDGMGMAATNSPRLQGQFDWYLITQLKNFKSGARGSDPKDINGSTMKAMSNTLPHDQAIKDVVAYIGTL